MRLEDQQRKWIIATVDRRSTITPELRELLEDSFEPFAIDDYKIYLRKQVTEEEFTNWKQKGDIHRYPYGRSNNKDSK